MQNNKAKNLNFTEILSNEPDNILFRCFFRKTLQIGYQAETLFYTRQQMIPLQSKNILMDLPQRVLCKSDCKPL